LKLNREKCDRCSGTEKAFTMSFFNTDWICEDCDEKEKKHPDYPKAKEAELKAIKQGNFNFEGIGLPEDLKRE